MNTDILTRVGMLPLLTEAQIRDLIADAMTLHMTHLLPREVVEHARRLAQAGALKMPAESIN